MTEDLITVTEDTGIFEVLQVLGDEAIRRVPIVDDQETLQGIVSLDDILVLLRQSLEMQVTESKNRFRAYSVELLGVRLGTSPKRALKR